MSTRKHKGGRIAPSKAFQHILSIGYEMETSDITKLSLVEDPYGGAGNVFLNTDTARKDMKRIMEGVEEDDPEYEDIIARQGELIEIDILDNNGKKDPHSSFLITNDVSKSMAFNLLGKYCNKEEEEESLESKSSSAKQAEYERLEEEKNKLYSVVSRKRVDKKISLVSTPIYFIHTEPKGCSSFTNVEWVMTYFDPNKNREGKKNKNVILETFMNSIQNLLGHMDKMVPMDVRLRLNNPTDPDTDILAKGATNEPDYYYYGGPRDRFLYKMPGENMHYLQLHYLPDKKVANTLDDVFVTIQMTFATKMENMFAVLSGLSCTKNMELTESSIGAKAANSNKMYSRIVCSTLKQLDDCINKLFDAYKNSLKAGSPLHKKYMAFLEKGEAYRRVKNAIFIILWKLFMFFNRWKTRVEPSEYFKNVVIFNFRHSNYMVYAELKKILMESMDITSEEARNMFMDIVLNEPILKKGLTTPMIPKFKEKTGIDVFSSKTFEKKKIYNPTDEDYGDPAKSLYCYFNFFEEPSEREDNIRDETPHSSLNSEFINSDQEEEEYEEDEESSELSQNSGQRSNQSVASNKQSRYWSHDWFIYANIDTYSNHMELKDNITLVELRHYPRLLFDYMYTIADPVLRKDLIIPKYQVENEINTTQVSLANLRRVLDIYNKKHRGSQRSATRKHRST